MLKMLGVIHFKDSSPGLISKELNILHMAMQNNFAVCYDSMWNMVFLL
jgi:hypothetical protein